MEQMFERGPDGDTDVVLAFANTHGFGHGPDRLVTGESLAGWLAEVGWFGSAPPPGSSPPSDADALDAQALRDALGVILLANTGETFTDADAVDEAAAVLQKAGRRYPLVALIDAEGVRLAPVGDGVSAVLGRVLAAVSALSLAGRWPRVKACRNPPCHRAFVDHSRNTSAAYCRPRCGGQVAMRAHRARLRDAERDT